MKDEEMAKKWVEDNKYGINEYCLSTEDFGEHGFLAGLKVGRPQWHDLQEDKNDLPKDDRYVLIATQKRVYLGFYDCCWSSHETDDIGEVLAWCEIPTFDKE